MPEHVIDLGAGGLGILDGVVQQRRHDGGVIELEVGQDRRDLERMGEIRVAGGAGLRAMRLHGVDIGAVQQVLVGVGIVRPDALDQIVLPHHARTRRFGRLCRRGRQRRHGHRIRSRPAFAGGCAANTPSNHCLTAGRSRPAASRNDLLSSSQPAPLWTRKRSINARFRTSRRQSSAKLQPSSDQIGGSRRRSAPRRPKKAS